MPNAEVNSGCANGLNTPRTMNVVVAPCGAVDREVRSAEIARRVVADVLDEGEADADQTGEDQPVEESVDDSAGAHERQQQEQALGRLLGERRDDRRHRVVAEVGGALSIQICRARAIADRDHATPDECGELVAARLGLVAVEPPVGEPQQRQRDQRESEREAGPDRVEIRRVGVAVTQQQHDETDEPRRPPMTHERDDQRRTAALPERLATLHTRDGGSGRDCHLRIVGHTWVAPIQPALADRLVPGITAHERP